MLKRKWMIVLVPFLIAAMFLVTGCPEEEVVPPVDPNDEPPDEPPVDEIVITVAGGAVGMELELTQRLAEAYTEEHEGVTVEVLDTPDDATERLGLYLQFFEAQSGEVDVYQIDVIWPGDLAEHFVDLYDYGAGEVVDAHFPEIVENNTVDGALIGIPWFTDAGLLYYRTDLLEEYGFDVPETWDDLEEAAQVIQDGERAENPDFQGFVWQGNAYEGLTTNALEWIDSNDGGTIVSPDQVITINNERAIEIVDQAAGWGGTISPEGVTTFAEEDARAVWHAGNAAFMRNWPYAYALSAQEDSAVTDVFNVTSLPAGASGEGSATLGGWQLAVSRYSEHPEVAADVALYMANYESQKMRAIDGTMIPTIMDLYEDEDVLDAHPWFEELYDVFINAVARPSTATAPQYSAVSELFFSAVHDVLTGQMNAADAFEILELDLEDLLGFPTE